MLQYPISFSVGNNQYLLHGFFEFLAFFVAFRYYLFLRKKNNDSITTNNRIWIIIGAIFGSTIGSRLIGGLEDFNQLQIADNKLVHFYLNKTVLGGFLGGLFGVELIKKIIKEKSSSGDLFTYPMILGLIIGRIGCFSMGVFEETYGITTTFFTGMNLGDNKLRHPVTLYEIGFLILLWIVIIQFEKKYVFTHGFRFKIFMITYILFRLFLDFIKPHYTLFIGLSTIQITSLIGLLYYSFVFYQNNKKQFYKKLLL